MHVLIVDGLNLIRRVHAALVASGADDRAVAEACGASLSAVLAKQHPTHAMCVMDSAAPSWRSAEFPDYKANRAPMPEDLRDALPGILEHFATLGVREVREEGFEADDVIATAATHIAPQAEKVTIISTDNGFCQILREGIRIHDHFSDRYLDRHYVRKRFDVEPEMLSTLFALAGDSSLNVSGVKSIGIRTAARLIHDFGALDNILAAADDLSGHIGEKLRSGKEDARRAMRLLSLRTDLELGLNLRDFRLSGR